MSADRLTEDQVNLLAGDEFPENQVDEIVNALAREVRGWRDLQTLLRERKVEGEPTIHDILALGRSYEQVCARNAELNERLAWLLVDLAAKDRSLEASKQQTEWDTHRIYAIEKPKREALEARVAELETDLADLRMVSPETEESFFERWPLHKMLAKERDFADRGAELAERVCRVIAGERGIDMVNLVLDLSTYCIDVRTARQVTP